MIVTKDDTQTAIGDYTGDYTKAPECGTSDRLEALAAALRNLTPDDRAALAWLLDGGVE